MNVTTWRYHLPNHRATGEGWAVCFLDSIGCFSVLSDYGDYGYRWPDEWSGPNAREDFRHFLTRIDGDYVLRKIAPRDTYMGEKTCKEVKRCILEARRSDAWSKEKARREWDLLDTYGNLESREDFARWYDHTEIDEAWEFAVWEPSPRAVAFIEKVFKRLQAHLREELAREGYASLLVVA